ncbi:DNA ligase D [Aureimonas fodinaquatilis]|uniref:DNA ligase (ATP) n=1 Tax=Aureimonas fodinaquatilis TaxID=2565783 RepID=A0A5B0DUN4_9HYPH|nr:DNA ligase D [Aureimonas fodinaquatilis]KAA0968919.1 DNA ligase D [Aureimonas fodinaquatilis]
MALDTYRKKRNFSGTSEPRGRKGRKSGDSFVIQKHDATRLHYDLRLEMDGVLKSWAVTKGPSLIAGEKRLAVHVEDHPLDYGDFEGTIPKGHYGAGDVIVWDNGKWIPVGDAGKGLAKGHLEFELQGQKLHGRWHLVRMNKPDEKRENWLLIKSDDEFARPKSGKDILRERPESIKTGRDIKDLSPETAKRKKPQAAKPTVPKARKAPLPDFIPPMLAASGNPTPSGAEWLHEIKFDGYRLQARIDGGNVSLMTRSGLDWTSKFGPGIVNAIKSLEADNAILDGELVVETGAGTSDFSALQSDISDGRDDRFVFYAFDLMHLNGLDLCQTPLTDRKSLLESLLAGAPDRLRYSQHYDESGAMVLQHACRLSLEGIISKQRSSRYLAGRGKNWRKSKCSARQEFVIGGYTPSTTYAKAIGSLVMGVFEDGKLRHLGRVGTGFTRKVAEQLFRDLAKLGTSKSPFSEKLSSDAASRVEFVKPELVAEVEFRAWTADGHLRHAAFRGLREDKPAKDIVRETLPASKEAKPPRRTIKLTHPDRLYWPDDGVTKEGLADYYSQIWQHIAPYVSGRPLALLRCPNGIGGEKFFQKHAWKGISSHITLVNDPAEPGGNPFIAISNLDGLLALVQSAVLEIHPWGAPITDWDHPDMLTMDIDPGDNVSWPAVMDAAKEIQQRLEASGLSAFVKTSGGKGLHVVAPLAKKNDWQEVKTFAKGLADAMAADSPDRYISTISKAKRRGKVFIDYLRNQRGSTAVAAYSTRARPGAAVSTPINWEELSSDIGPDYFTVLTLPVRLDGLTADPWQDFWAAAAPLGKRKAR